MKKIYAIVMAGAAVLAASCAKENLPKEDAGKTAVEYVDLQLSSVMEGRTTLDTRTSVGSDGTVSWSDGDLISLFDNSAAAQSHNNSFTYAGDGKFSGQVPEDATEFYALYPYSAAASFAGGSISTALPADQIAAVGTFADNVAIMAGKVSDSSIEFKNLCSHISFTLAVEGVKSITLIGNKNEALCGTFSVSFTDGEPSVTVSKPETYVRLYNADGSALAQGTYYFTVLPVEFEDGFTVILSKESDGTQVAAKTVGKIDGLNKRNQILPMVSVPSDKFSEYMNYFVRYNDGFPIAVGDADNGGVTFSKETNPGGVLVNSTVGNTTIKKDGVYFICDEDTPAQISYNEISDLVVCGAESSTRSKLEFGKTLQPTTNESGNLLFENLIITPAASFNNDFIAQKKADKTPGTAFGSIVFDSCTITTARHLIYIINAATSIGKISVLNCDYFSKAAAACVVSFASQASTVSELNIRNNVFCPAADVTMTDFKVLNGAAATVNNINAYSNTFDHTTMVNAGCFIVYGVDNCYIMYNLCNETVLTTAHSTLGNYKGTATSINGSVVNNYYYTSGEKSLNNALKPVKSGSPVKLSASPLSSEWNPAGGVYGTYSINAVDEKNQPTAALLKLIGAKRADM